MLLMLLLVIYPLRRAGTVMIRQGIVLARLMRLCHKVDRFVGGMEATHVLLQTRSTSRWVLLLLVKYLKI